MEAEQTQQLPAISESASATFVAYIGDRVERSHSNSNQAFYQSARGNCMCVCVCVCVCVTFS